MVCPVRKTDMAVSGQAPAACRDSAERIEVVLRRDRAGRGTAGGPHPGGLGGGRPRHVRGDGHRTVSGHRPQRRTARPPVSGPSRGSTTSRTASSPYSAHRVFVVRRVWLMFMAAPERASPNTPHTRGHDTASSRDHATHTQDERAEDGRLHGRGPHGGRRG